MLFKAFWLVKRFGQYGRKVSWKVIIYEIYGRNPSWIAEWFGKYGRKVSWIVKISENAEEMKIELWNDMENMEEKSVE